MVKSTLPPKVQHRRDLCEPTPYLFLLSAWRLAWFSTPSLVVRDKSQKAEIRTRWNVDAVGVRSAAAMTLAACHHRLIPRARGRWPRDRCVHEQLAALMVAVAADLPYTMSSGRGSAT